MKIFKTLKWLFTQAPQGISTGGPDFPCIYCLKTGFVWHYVALDFAYCPTCLRKVMDSVLLQGTKINEGVDKKEE